MRFARLLALVTISTLACGAFGCSSDGRGDSPVGDETEDELRRAGVVDVSASDEGKTIVVEKGKGVRLTLPANATTGFKWKVTSTNRTFGYPSPADGKYSGGGSDGPVGGGGKVVFTWKTSGPNIIAGNNVHRVTLEYRRSFEDADGPAEKSFSFAVRIKAAGQEEQPEETERVCPTSSFINCMPPTTNPYCRGDLMQWARENCDVSFAF